MSLALEPISKSSDSFNPGSNWTFEHALALLKTETTDGVNDPVLANSLDKFLQINKDVFLSLDKLFPFTKKSDPPSDENIPTSIELRGMKYSTEALSALEKTCIKQAANLLQVSLLEATRIVVQFTRRCPTNKASDASSDSSRLNGILKSNEKIDLSILYMTKIASEQRSIFKLLNNLLDSDLNTLHSTSELIVKYITEKLSTESYIELIDQFVGRMIEMNQQREDSNSLEMVDSQLEGALFYENTLFLLDALQLLESIILKSQVVLSKSAIFKWFKLMRKSSFMADVKYFGQINDYANFAANQLYTDNYTNLISTIEAIATVISLSVLDLDFNSNSLSIPESFINSKQTLTEITEDCISISDNAILSYAWSIILHRKYVLEAELEEESRNTDFLDFLQASFVLCSTNAEKLNFIESLSNCFSILQFNNLYANVLGSFVISFLPYITLTEKIATVINKVISQCSNTIVESFFSNSVTEDMITIQRTKLPISIKPFIKLVSLNSNLAIHELSNLKSYMEVFNEDEFYYKYRIDDTNPDLISLTQDVDIAPPYENSNELSLLLKEGTKGQIFPGNEKNKTIVAFLYEYNGWSLIGRMLKYISKSTFDRDWQSIPTEADSEKLELAVDILKLLSKVLGESENDQITKVLKSMSAFVGDSKDIIEVVLRIMDQAFLIRNVDVLVACLNFLSVLCEIGYSYRVWPYIYTSNLLSFKVSDGGANIILSTVEMISGKYDFTIALFELIETLINDCLVLDDRTTSSKLKSEVMAELIAHVMRAFENHTYWTYNEKYQKFKFSSLAIDILNKVVFSVYGVDSTTTKLELKITGVFALASKRILSAFLVPDTADARITKPILNTVDSLSLASLSLSSTDLTGFWKDQYHSLVFEFSSNLISTRPVYQDTNPSTFEKTLFAKVPNMIDIYARNLELRYYILKLLTNLIDAPWKGVPPSLLTYLDEKHTNILLHCLAADIGNNLESNSMKVALCDFFASVMKGNQQGLSTVFITGRDIKGWLLDKKKNEKPNKNMELSLLKILKRNVASIPHYPNSTALHLVDAISLAYNSWNTVKEEGDDQDFIEKLLLQLKDFDSVDTSFAEDNLEMSDGNIYEEYTRTCYELKLLSKISEILSLYLFVSHNIQCKTKIFETLKSSEFIEVLDARFKIKGYTTSVIPKVNEVFIQNWGSSGLSLTNFEHTGLFKKHRWGTDAVYSFNLLDSYFSKDSVYWDSFRDELLLASIKYQFASAQISFAKSLGALITCFCKTYPEQLPPHYLDLAINILKINENEGIPTSLEQSTYQERIELTFLICFLFSKKGSGILSGPAEQKKLFAILSTTTGVLMSSEVNFMGSIVSCDGVSYYKSLLRIFLIALQMLDHNSPLLVEFSATFADMFESVACKSIKAIFGSVQNEAISHPNKDFNSNSLLIKQIEDSTLILSIWKQFLSLQLPKSLESAISRSLSKTGTLTTILSLYSCSHLIKINSEEVFAELSLMYLYDLVSVKFVAEKLIASGLYCTLTESPMSVIIQKRGVSATSSTAAHLHHLWSDGILSIVLTTLGMFGDRLLDEAIIFTKVFKKQFSNTLRSWFESSSVISTAKIQETSQIIYLAKILNSMDASTYVQNDIAFKDGLIPGLDSREERYSFIASLNYLISHPKYLTSRVVPINAEQQDILTSKSRSKFTDELVKEIKQLKESLMD